MKKAILALVLASFALATSTAFAADGGGRHHRAKHHHHKHHAKHHRQANPAPAPTDK